MGKWILFLQSTYIEKTEDKVKNIFLESLQCAHEETGLGERKIKPRGKVLENGFI